MIYCALIMIDSASGIFTDAKGVDEITSTVVISSERLPQASPGSDEIQARPAFLFGRSRNMFLSCKE